VLTLFPLIGALGVRAPAVVYLVAAGRPTAGTAIAVYGLLVTLLHMSLRPALLDRTGGFDSATIVIGIYGGLVVFDTGTVALIMRYVTNTCNYNIIYQFHGQTCSTRP